MVGQGVDGFDPGFLGDLWAAVWVIVSNEVLGIPIYAYFLIAIVVGAIIKFITGRRQLK